MSGSVTVVLADDEDRCLDEEPEVAVLERRAVALAHQEPDQALVALGHLVGREVERDARGVDDREVAREGTVEREEAVVEDLHGPGGGCGCLLDRHGHGQRRLTRGPDVRYWR